MAKITIDTAVKEICFDMDGTICDFYGVDGWLDCLIREEVRPYEEAKPLHDLAVLARMINRLKRCGYTIKIISWLSKTGTPEYNEQVRQAKLKWLRRHMPSVQWDEIHIVTYGTPKYIFGNGILFDDEDGNRTDWKGLAFTPDDIKEVLKNLK